MQTQFTSDERNVICDMLGESPFTVISLYQIRRGDVNMVLVSEPDKIQGLVVQSHQLLEEPNAFGDDVSAIVSGLQMLQGWTCVNVDRSIADELSKAIEADFKRHIRHYDDVHYVLERPISNPNTVIDGIELRLLHESDIPLLENAPVDLLNSDRCKYIAGGIVDKRMVAIAHAHALSDMYADVGVSTEKAYRLRGISTALSQIVMTKLQADGYVPVWSTGEDNHASKRVAEKLGMTFYGSRVYLILEEKN